MNAFFPLKMPKTTLWLISAITVFLTSCADVTSEEWRKLKVREELAKVQRIAGVWRGNVLFAQDNLPMGTVTLSLEADTRLQLSDDRLTTEQYAVLGGSLSYEGTKSATAVFDQAYYNDKTGEFKATIPVGESSSTTVWMQLKGSISGNELTGRFEAALFPEFGATVSLIKDGPSIASANLTSGRIAHLKAEEQVFTAKYQYREQERKVRMSFAYPGSPTQSFVNPFLPIRNLRVHWEVVGRYSYVFDRDCTIDDRKTTDTITCECAAPPTSLRCNRLSPSATGPGWACVIEGQNDKKLQLDLWPDSDSSSKTKGP